MSWNGSGDDAQREDKRTPYLLNNSGGTGYTGPQDAPRDSWAARDVGQVQQFEGASGLAPAHGRAAFNFTQKLSRPEVRAEVKAKVESKAQTQQQVPAGMIITYYYPGGQRVAMRQGGTSYYLLTDHLGSTSAAVDQNGNVVAGQLYKPYGEPR